MTAPVAISNVLFRAEVASFVAIQLWLINLVTFLWYDECDSRAH